MLNEFRVFATRGNMIDLAVGVIIGGAFGRIVDSLVQDVIMPPISVLFGGLDFSSYYLPLNGQVLGLPLVEAKKAGARRTSCRSAPSASTRAPCGAGARSGCTSIRPTLSTRTGARW